MEITIVLLLAFNSVLLLLIVAAIINGMTKRKQSTPPKIVVEDKKVDVPNLSQYLPVITVTETDLRNELIRCLDNEEYERASHIRDILEKVKRNRDDLP